MVFDGKNHIVITPSNEKGQPIFKEDGYYTRLEAMDALDFYFRKNVSNENGQIKNNTVDPQYTIIELHGWQSANYDNISFS